MPDIKLGGIACTFSFIHQLSGSRATCAREHAPRPGPTGCGKSIIPNNTPLMFLPPDYVIRTVSESYICVFLSNETTVIKPTETHSVDKTFWPKPVKDTPTNVYALARQTNRAEC